MQIVPVEDMDFFAQQSSGKLNMIISGMTALMNDNDSKVAQLESQNWFQRMCRTITGKNKATQAEIQRNHDKINAYMSEAISELYNRNLIDHEIILSLGTQINELYADHIQLKQMLGAFAAKLNEKIESVDNFHMLMEEISQGVYSSGRPLVEICKVISQLDRRTLNDGRKLDIVRRGLVSQGILSDEQIGLKEYLAQVVAIPSDYAGQIYLELETIRGNFMAGIILAMMDDYHFLPDMARKMKNKPAMIADVIEAGRLDESITLSTSEVYDDFINSKIEAVNGLVHVTSALPSVAFDENTTDFDEIRRAAEAGIPEAQYKLGEMYYDKGSEYDILEDDQAQAEQNYAQAIKWYRKAAEQGHTDAQKELGDMYYFGNGTKENEAEAEKWYLRAIKGYRKVAEQGDEKAQIKLGDIYCVIRDYARAFEWYRRAAQQGNADAQYKLGDMYNIGYIEQNKEEARKWYRKAAEQGNKLAISALETIDMTLDELLEAVREAEKKL